MSQSQATRRQQIEQLARVHALSGEIAAALAALEKNDLVQFEIHVAAQEGLCSRIVPPTSELPDEVREAHLALAQINRVYAAVLKRAEKTTGLMLTLYRGQGQGYDRASFGTDEHRTWSCEV